MGEVKQDLHQVIPQPVPVGYLEVLLTGPRMSGFAGPAWPRTCTIYVGIDGAVVGGQKLPFEFDREELKRWRLGVRIPVVSDWPQLSLDIFVERADFLYRRVTRGGPHTSGHTAVISRARVRLLDALVLGDFLDDDDDEEEEEEEEEEMKRRRNEAEAAGGPRLMEGTMPFGKVVQLIDWELPALGPGGDEYRNPRCVVRGTVDVCMHLRPPFFIR